MDELAVLNRRLTGSVTPEEVFGKLAGTPDEQLTAVKRDFRAMALVAHPDRSPASKALAESTFNLLETWRRRAEDRIRAGTYGKGGAAAAEVINTRAGSYMPGPALARRDYYTLYACTRMDRSTMEKCVLKIVTHPRDNDLLERELDVLRELSDQAADGAAPQVARYVPRLLHAFTANDGATSRRALILEMPPRSASLLAIRNAYPAGLDPRDAAWIFNRLLEALYFLHRHGTLNGAILPTNLWADLDNHGLRIAEWAAAISVGKPLPLMSTPYASWYPPEVQAKQPASPGTDIFMAGTCLIWLLGGDPVAGTMPATVPTSIQRFAKSCVIPASRLRPADAGELREEFGDLLKRLYGKPAFRPLAILA